MTPGQYQLLGPTEKILADLAVEIIRHLKRIADALEDEAAYK